MVTKHDLLWQVQIEVLYAVISIVMPRKMLWTKQSVFVLSAESNFLCISAGADWKFTESTLVRNRLVSPHAR